MLNTGISNKNIICIQMYLFIKEYLKLIPNDYSIACRNIIKLFSVLTFDNFVKCFINRI